MAQSDNSLPLGARTWPRLYVALLGVAAAVACFLPLADHLGYEFSELIALLAGLFGGIPGISASRTSRPRLALQRAVSFGLFALLLPLGIVLLNGLRRPACDPLGGLPLYFLLTVPSAVLAAAIGVLCGGLAPKRAGTLYALTFLTTLAVSLWPVARGPQVFAFHHLGGLYPGPIYDEQIKATSALLFFRCATVLYALACSGVALRSSRGLAVALVCGLPAVAISSRATALHFSASASQLDEELGATLATDHLVLHFPREKTQLERELLAKDAEAGVRAVLQFLGSQPDGRKVDVYLYRSAAEKRTLIGAADTSFTKPWLREIHTNDGPAPHAILRHELVHALAASIAHGPWGVPGKLGGLLPEMALIEGTAVAGDWPPGEFTAHEEARALLDLKLLPALPGLFAPGRFYGESGPRAYTTSGSFIRWLWETRGPAELRALYAGEKQLDLATLSPQYLAFLGALKEPPRAVALASQRFSAPAITRKPCAHEVAGLEQDARDARDPAAAAALWQRCTSLEPDDPSLLVQLRRSQLAAGDAAAGHETELRALDHPKLSQPLRAQLLTEIGDAAWKAGNVPAAQQRYEEAAQLPQGEAAERSLAVRLIALKDPPSWPALRPLLVDAETGPDVLLTLRDLDLARPRDGLPTYLIAKQLQNRGAWEACAKYAQSALAHDLPGPLFIQEAQRMRGIAAWHLHDAATARLAFTALGKDAPPGRALEAARWLERL